MFILLLRVTCISGTASIAAAESGSVAAAGLTSERARRRSADSSWCQCYGDQLAHQRDHLSWFLVHSLSQLAVVREQVVEVDLERVVVHQQGRAKAVTAVSTDHPPPPTGR